MCILGTARGPGVLVMVDIVWDETLEVGRRGKGNTCIALCNGFIPWFELGFFFSSICLDRRIVNVLTSGS